jgi:hypothetical protein
VAVLQWLAAFHGYWWGRPLQGLFQPGGWWRKELKPTVDFAQLPNVFASHMAAFPALATTLDTPDNRALMQALPGLCQALHDGEARAPHITLIHGDVKASNVFFPLPAAPTAPAGPPVFFDFQWVGSASSGLADVAYFIAGGVEPGEVLGGGCTALLRAYHAALCGALGARGIRAGEEPLASWESCVAAFERELVIYYSVAAPYLLAGLTPRGMEENRTKYGWLQHEMNETMLWWLTSSVLAALKKTPLVGLK